jgi:hypothetical protein
MTQSTKKRAAAFASDMPKHDKRAGKPEPSQPKKQLRRSPDDEMITADVLEFIAAIEEYRKKHNRPFPTWSEILKIVTDLGYRRVAGATKHRDAQ